MGSGMLERMPVRRPEARSSRAHCGVAGAGSLAMVATGMATLTAHLAVPWSAAILGPMAIAYLYKAFTSPEERKQKEIHNKLQDIEDGIRKVLQGAKENTGGDARCR